MPFLSVVIPAYNEAKRLPHTLQAVLAYLKKQDYDWEVVIVDDGSTDTTADLVCEAARTEPRIGLLQYGQNQGKGYAVAYGMNHVHGQYRLFMDADNSTSIDQIEPFWPYARGGYDVVIGSRDVRGAHIAIHQIWWKELLGDLGNLWIRFWAVRGLKDTQAGFKLFSSRAAQAIFPHVTIHDWGFDIEVLAIAHRRGFKIAERPIRWLNDPHSKVKSSAYLTVLREVLQVRFNLWRRVYDQAVTNT